MGKGDGNGGYPGKSPGVSGSVVRGSSHAGRWRRACGAVAVAMDEAEDVGMMRMWVRVRMWVGMVIPIRMRLAGECSVGLLCSWRCTPDGRSGQPHGEGGGACTGPDRRRGEKCVGCVWRGVSGARAARRGESDVGRGGFGDRACCGCGSRAKRSEERKEVFSSSERDALLI
jgi:hypothetical protein